MSSDRDECKHKFSFKPVRNAKQRMRTKAKYKSKIASNKGKCKKLKDNSEVKQNKRWIFDDEITEGLVECLVSYKVDKEGEGIDFEGDLVQLYGDIRKRMAERYDEDNFGPVEHVAATTDVNEMSKEDYKTFKDKFDKDRKSMKLGYDRVKAKIKKFVLHSKRLFWKVLDLAVEELLKNTGTLSYKSGVVLLVLSP